jgi:hypothetical protein
MKTIIIDQRLHFEAQVKSTLAKIESLLITKGREYQRNNDVFHNFNQGSNKTGKTPEEVLKGFLLKHEISVDDMIQDISTGKLPKLETVEEKLNDILVYNIILKCMIISRL